MLFVSHLECRRRDRRIFSEVGFRLGAGEMLYLQGPNGSGKTSLLRILCGLMPSAGGEIHWRGEPVGQLGEDYRRNLCFLGHRDAIKDEFTPLENLMISSRLARIPLDERQTLTALARLGLTGCEDLICRHLSQGQKRRVALSRLAVERCPLWLLDEPFTALDTAAIGRVAGLIGEHLKRGGLAVLTTHQIVEIPAGSVQSLVLADEAAPC